MAHEFRGTNFWDTLYFTLVCLWCGRTVGRSVHGHVITKFSRMGSLPHFLTHGKKIQIQIQMVLRCARFASESSATMVVMLVVVYGCLYWSPINSYSKKHYIM